MTEGTRDKQPRPNCHLMMTASQVKHFAEHSVALLEPLLDQHREAVHGDSAWLCWRAHFGFLNFMMRYSFTPADVQTLDRLIYIHQVRPVATEPPSVI